MGKKHVRRAAAAAKEALEKTKNEAKDAVEEVKDDVTTKTADVVEAAEKKMDAAGDEVKDAAQKVRGTSRKKDIRNWLILIAIALVIAVVYKAIMMRGDSAAQMTGDDEMTLMEAPDVSEEDAMDSKKWGYVVGAMVGEQIAVMIEDAPGRDEMDMKMFERGISEAVRGDEKPYMTMAEANAILEMRMQIEQDKMIAVAQENAAASEAFLAEYAQRDGVEMLDDESGVLYMIKESGDGQIVGDQFAQLHYKGMLMDGTVFDDSREAGEEPVSLSTAVVVPGFGAALSQMRVGDTWEFAIPADQAYGEMGMPMAGIEPNAVLIFEVEVVGIDEAAVNLQ